MKTIFFACLSMLFFVSVNAQEKKNHYEFSIGMQRLQNKTVFTIQPYFDCLNGAYFLSDVREESINLPTLTFLRYNGIGNKNLNFISGLGFNQKGYMEKGTLHPREVGRSAYAYATKHIASYVTAHSGISYSFLSLGQLRFCISEVINLETRIPSIDNYDEDAKTFALSLNSCLTAALPVSKNCDVIIKPFFQTALTKYNNVRKDFEGQTLNNNYRPFGFGLSVGVNF